MYLPVKNFSLNLISRNISQLRYKLTPQLCSLLLNASRDETVEQGLRRPQKIWVVALYQVSSWSCSLWFRLRSLTYQAANLS